MRPSTGLWAVAVLALSAGAARAESDLFSAGTFSGVADLRLTAADGEPSWIRGGFGKTDASGGGDEVAVRPRLAEAALEWRPQLSFSLSAVVSARWQPEVEPGADFGEAYLKWRAPPNAVARVSARAGLFYPPVSVEHEGPAWTSPEVLTPSAIGSWIGEEVKVGGLEVTASRQIGAHEVAATAAVFGWNDTSGTLLTFRGWALHGIKVGANSQLPLPPLSAFMSKRQDPFTYPTLELDGRAGFYGAVRWRPPAPVTLSALYYDNAGDRTSVEGLQWAWETRFLHLSAQWEPNERTALTAQLVNGETLMGYRSKGVHRWIDMGYRAAYLQVGRRFGEDMLTARADWFETNDRTLRYIDNNDETGWALTAAWRHGLNPHADLVLEAAHVRSDRPSRAYGGVAAEQDQTVLQTALRLSF